MDVHKHSLKVARLEIVDTGRRRRWSEDEKLKIVLESFQSPRQVAATARRHGISRWQLHEWRRAFRATQADAARPQAGFVPATLAVEPIQPAVPEPSPSRDRDSGAIEIDFANGARMRVTGAIDEATLAAALRALSDGRRSR
jgi:transposase